MRSYWDFVFLDGICVRFWVVFGILVISIVKILVIFEYFLYFRVKRIS